MTLQLTPSVGRTSACEDYNSYDGIKTHQTSPHHAESANVHQQGELHDLEHGNDMGNQQEGSLQTLHTGGSGYRPRRHLVHEQADEKDLQREIDDLKKRLHRAQ